ncbi:MAG: hypothetical protein AMK75_02380 [Planctomycetes bacterium SM23_65]|nr:MAG: hypothetical protein AMK75_02380 [Planctomycetes bacterium SM23_65]
MPERRIDVVYGADRFPYSRGILTRSLVDVGVPLEVAYHIANDIQDELAQQGEITRDALRNRVADRLNRELGEEAAQTYLNRRQVPSTISVISGREHVPFSKGILSRSIRATGVQADKAYQVSRQIEESLLRTHSHELTSPELRRLAYREIARICGRDAAERYLVWRSFTLLEKPLVIAIGGTAAAGKSTLAVELAHRLGITNVVGSDSIREIMRTMFSDDLLPLLHRSSYSAHESFTAPHRGGGDPVIEAFHEQVLRVSVGIRGMLRRAAAENEHMIIHGVHVLPEILQPENFPNLNVSRTTSSRAVAGTASRSSTMLPPTCRPLRPSVT